MNSVQSVWFKTSNNALDIDYSCGWLHSSFHFASWALSSLQLSRFFSEINLVTDSIGADIATKLKLPYTTIITDLDYQKTINPLWVSNKLYTYSIQKAPFIHVDTDAYFFNEVPIDILKAPLFAQNFEYDHDNYCGAYSDVLHHCSYIPDIIAKDKYGRLTAVNAGVIGGMKYEFFHEFTAFVNQFLHFNQQSLEKCHYDHLNVFVEQYLFTQFALAKTIPVSYVSRMEFGPPCDYKMSDFNSLPLECNYIHVTNYKRNPTICEQLAQRLWLESPELYERVFAVSRGLETSYHVVSSKPSLKNPFYRSNHLLNDIGLPVDVSLTSAEQLDTYIESFPNIKQKAQLKDLLQFEKRKDAFRRSLPDQAELWQYWQFYSQQVNEWLAKSPTQYSQAVVRLGKYCERIDAEWNWTEINEFVGQEADRNWSDNLLTEQAYFEVLLYYYPHQQLIREQLLDALNILILDTLNVAQTIESVIESVSNQLRIYQPIVNSTELTDTLLARIRHFLYYGILEIMT